jgi:hypothetical protein
MREVLCRQKGCVGVSMCAAAGGVVYVSFFLVAAQIKKYKYSKASQWEHRPILVRIPPLKEN